MSDAVTVRDLGPQGMVTLRGDLSSTAFKAACKALSGLDIPERNKILIGKSTSLAWMSPDELLLILPHADAPSAAARFAADMGAEHSLAVDVSDARALMAVEGSFAAEVLAKLTPADVSPDAFGPGDFRRTRLGQVAAAIWCEAPGTYRVICFRSVAEYALNLLVASAEAGPVGHF